MNNQDLIDPFLDRLKFSDFRASVTFDMGDEGVVTIDASQIPAQVIEGEAESDLRVTTGKEMLKGFLDGSKDPNLAFMTGKLKISGSMGLAMKLNTLFDD